MRVAIIIWVILGFVIVGGTLYMNNEINNLIMEADPPITQRIHPTLEAVDNNGGDQLNTYNPQPAGLNE